MALDEKLEAMLEGSFIVKDVQELARRYRKQKEALEKIKEKQELFIPGGTADEEIYQWIIEALRED